MTNRAELLALAAEMENFGDVWDRTDAVTNVDTACRHWANRLRAIASIGSREGSDDAANLLRQSLPFISFAYSSGIVGAEELGREIENFIMGPVGLVSHIQETSEFVSNETGNVGDKPQTVGPAGEAALELATLIRSGIKTDNGTFFTDRGMAAVEGQLKEVMRAVAQAQPVGLPELPVSYGDIHVYDSVRVMREPGYTADQLRDYAARAAGVDALDAVRYRYLRDIAHPDLKDGLHVCREEPNSWGKWSSPSVSGEDLDRRIDVAISEQAGAEGKK